MSTRNQHGAAVHDHAETDHLGHVGPHHGEHGWMMIVCCIPMLIIAVVLVATGVAAGFLFAALACTAMMAAMMAGMHGGGHDDRR